MPFNETAMQLAANTLRTAATYGQLHSGPAGETYTDNVTTAARQPLTWTAPSALGDFNLAAQVDFTGGAAGGAVLSITVWDAAEDGVCYGEFAFTGGDPAFSAGGLYSVTAIDVTGTVESGGSF